MPDDPLSPERSWADKFRDAFRGLKAGVRERSTYFVHFFATAAVIVAAAVLRVDRYEWCLLLLCITGVLVAEMFNSALEAMAKAVTSESHPHLRDSLDIGAAAVLVASIGAAIVGTLIFGHRLGILLNWW
jgi:diacylglycerol kinase